MTWRAWDAGVCWHLELTEAPGSEPLDATTVLTDHLRTPDPSVEVDYVDGLIASARRMAERVTQRALVPQTWALVLDRFPCGAIRIPKPPLIDIESITYIDENGAEQTWNAALYQVIKPTGPTAGYGLVCPAYNEMYPTTRSQTAAAVTVTFRAGYSDGASPEGADIPDDILHGMQLVIGEFYKQRSESVHAFNQNPALIRARDLWSGYRVF